MVASKGQTIVLAGVLVAMLLPDTEAFSLPTSTRQLSASILRKQCSASRFAVASTRCSAHLGKEEVPSRRSAVALIFSLLLTSPMKTEAKGGKAAGGGGDPKDKQKLEDAWAVIQDLEAKLKDESKWGDVIETVSKEPFTKDSMEKMFSLAAKSLPSNIQKIYGGDGGQWVGLKNEAVDAMDAFGAEITYLDGERKKGKPAGDTTDLKQYYATVREKTKEFLSLYSNTALNSQLKGGGFCAYSSSAKCDEFDNSKDVKDAVKAGGIYNDLRLGR